jgi:two-component sensor histidine kinase
MNEAISCGLILQELLSNSIKYAFPDEAGSIRIEFYQRHGECVLRYCDSGVGLPENVSIREPKSLGLQLICDLVCQLQGRFAYRYSSGANFTIKFKSQEEQRTKEAAAT